MKEKYKYLFVACFAITFVDALGAIASRQFNFNYSFIWPASLLVYFVLGFTLTKIKNIKTSASLTALLGVFDATIGWSISISLKANTGSVNDYPTLQNWILTIIFVAVFSALVGVIGGGIAKWFFKPAADNRGKLQP